MSEPLQPDDFDRRARQHRECAKLSWTPDLVRFHNDLAARLEQLAAESRDLLNLG